jgi:putative hydrolase of the HAD superfamily
LVRKCPKALECELMIQAVIFDVGGVLILKKGKYRFKRLSELLEVEFNNLMRFKEKYFDSINKGKLSKEKYFYLMKKELKTKKDTINNYKKAFLKSMCLNKDLLKFVDKIKQNYKIGIVSNVQQFDAEIWKEMGFPQEFDAIVLSYKVGCLKPRREIYKIALKKLKLKANECVFVDDYNRNLITTEKMGFKTILFKSNKQLKSDFKKLRIKF